MAGLEGDAGLIRVKEEGGDGEDRLLLGLWIRC